MEENNLAAKGRPKKHVAAKIRAENHSSARRGPRKSKNGAGVDSNREIMQSTLPEKINQEGNLDMDIDPSGLEIGEDGNYYICLVCGDGGDLICCDNGPCTFHKECLSPPFQNVGEGKWKCPRCSKRKKRRQARNVSKRPKNSLAARQ